MLLLKYKNNYADEFDIEGILLLNQEEEEKYRAILKSFPEVKTEEFLHVIGTNQEVFYSIEENIQEIDVPDIGVIQQIVDDSGRFGSIPFVTKHVLGWIVGYHPECEELMF